MKKGLLLLEGGAFRGIFTSGVLDAFLKNDIYFDTVVGISAGALCGYNYVSKDVERSKKIIIDYGQDRRYFGATNLIRTGSAFGTDFVFNEIPKSISFNYEQFKLGARFFVGATNCNTGKCEYFSKNIEGANFEDCIIASSAMPLVSKMVDIKGQPYLDGGISDNLPLGFLDYDDYDVVVTVLTKPLSERKTSMNRTQSRLYKIWYRHYPNLLQQLLKEVELFNTQRELMTEYKEQGKMIIIEPDERFKVKRLERNVKYIKEGYDLGFQAGEEYVEAIRDRLI